MSCPVALLSIIITYSGGNLYIIIGLQAQKVKKKNRYNNLFFGIIFLSFTLHYINLIFIKKLLIIVIIIYYFICFFLYKFIIIIFLYFSIVSCNYFPFFSLCLSIDKLSFIFAFYFIYIWISHINSMFNAISYFIGYFFSFPCIYFCFSC